MLFVEPQVNADEIGGRGGSLLEDVVGSVESSCCQPAGGGLRFAMRRSSSLLIAVGGSLLLVTVIVGHGHGGSLIGSGVMVVVVGIGPLASQVAHRDNVGDGWQTGHVSVGEVRWSHFGQLIADHWLFAP